MESTKREDAATTTREGDGVKESEMKTDEDDEFERIERENKIKGQPYHFAPQSTWVGLTDDERIELLPPGDWEVDSTLEFAQQIENILRIKNELR
jgi:hypothetical protein